MRIFRYLPDPATTMGSQPEPRIIDEEKKVAIVSDDNAQSDTKSEVIGDSHLSMISIRFSF